LELGTSGNRITKKW